MLTDLEMTTVTKFLRSDSRFNQYIDHALELLVKKNYVDEHSSKFQSSL